MSAMKICLGVSSVPSEKRKKSCPTGLFLSPLLFLKKKKTPNFLSQKTHKNNQAN